MMPDSRSDGAARIIGRARRRFERFPPLVAVPAALVTMVVGLGLASRPFTSVEVMVVLAGIVGVVVGARTLVIGVRHRRSFTAVVGLAYSAVGAYALAQWAVAVESLSAVAGILLVILGFGAFRWAFRPNGLSSTALRVQRAMEGLIAITLIPVTLGWPDLTTMVLGVAHGVAVAALGVSMLVVTVRAWRSRRDGSASPDAADQASGDPQSGPADVPSLPTDPGPVAARLVLRAAVLLVALGLLTAMTTLKPGATEISHIYDSPIEIPEAGQLLDVEPYTDAGMPENAHGLLISYSTTTALDRPTVATAVVVVPNAPSPEPRPVVAWTHGTVGIARRCAPSISGDALSGLSSFQAAVDRGWVVVATDYAGMGTPGVSPYLVGAGQAHSALDSLRAVQQAREVGAGDRSIVWGHSQGGHAALWTGMLAPTYAPDLDVLGVAAVSPATDLPAMAESIQGHLGGALASAYVIAAYSGTYPDVSFEHYVRPGARANVRAVAGKCVDDPSLLVSVVSSLPSSQSIFAADPSSGPAGRRLAENTPNGEIGVPLLVAQGTADEVIPFEITEEWVGERCRAGQPLQMVAYPDRTHMSVLEDDSGLPTLLERWSDARFAGGPADGDTC